MLSEYRVGPVYGSPGSVNPGRSSRHGAAVVAGGGGKYTEGVLQGNCFWATAVGASLGTALTGTAVTLTVYNPLGSGVYAAILQASFGITTQITAATNSTVVHAVVDPALANIIPTSVTAVIVRNCLVGGGQQGRVVAYSAATLGAAPISARIAFHYENLGARTAEGSISKFNGTDYVDGALVLMPGFSVTLQGIGTTLVGTVSYMWEEIPMP